MWRSFACIVVFSEDGPCHVQRRLVTSKNLVHPLWLRMRGKGGCKRGPAQASKYVQYVSCQNASCRNACQGDFSLAWKPTGVGNSGSESEGVGKMDFWHQGAGTSQNNASRQR